MTLAALVAAYDGDAEGLRVARSLAGVPIVEHQFRRLAAAGATRILLLVEEWPPVLAAVLHRLRGEGVAVQTVASVAEAAERLAPGTRLLLLADGCLPDRALVEELAASPAPTLATIPDGPQRDAYERIDADSRWAGAALLDRAALDDTAAIVGDWDPVSTLLRRAVQQGARRLSAGAVPPVMTGEADGVALAERRLLAQSRERPADWCARAIELPLAERLLPLLFARRAAPGHVEVAAAALAALGGLLALAGVPRIALACLLPTGVLLRTAARLALVQARPLPWTLRVARVRLGGLALGCVGLGLGLWRQSLQWGHPLLAAALIALLAAQHRLRPLAELRAGPPPPWLATASAMPWLLLPAALTGYWGTGLALAAAYAAASAAATLAAATREA